MFFGRMYVCMSKPCNLITVHRNIESLLLVKPNTKKNTVYIIVLLLYILLLRPTPGKSIITKPNNTFVNPFKYYHLTAHHAVSSSHPFPFGYLLDTRTASSCSACFIATSFSSVSLLSPCESSGGSGNCQTYSLVSGPSGRYTGGSASPRSPLETTGVPPVTP